jgi:hypothetical protein
MRGNNKMVSIDPNLPAQIVDALNGSNVPGGGDNASYGSANFPLGLTYIQSLANL